MANVFGGGVLLVVVPMRRYLAGETRPIVVLDARWRSDPLPVTIGRTGICEGVERWGELIETVWEIELVLMFGGRKKSEDGRSVEGESALPSTGNWTL